MTLAAEEVGGGGHPLETCGDTRRKMHMLYLFQTLWGYTETERTGVSTKVKRRVLGFGKTGKCLARCVLKFQCRRINSLFLENIIKGTEVSFSWLGVQIVDFLITGGVQDGTSKFFTQGGIA